MKCRNCGREKPIASKIGWCGECIADQIWAEDEDPDADYCFTCENTREIDCDCGGDLCVCLHGPTLPCTDCC